MPVVCKSAPSACAKKVLPPAGIRIPACYPEAFKQCPPSAASFSMAAALNAGWCGSGV